MSEDDESKSAPFQSDDSDEDLVVTSNKPQPPSLAKSKKNSKKRKKSSTDKHKKRKKPVSSDDDPPPDAFNMIDDSAVLSGEESDEDEDEDDEMENDYIKDDFVVDEADDEDNRKPAADGLEDSDDDDDDDDGDGDAGRSKRKRFKKVGLGLDEDDLELILESQGIVRTVDVEEEEEVRDKRRIKARSEAELRKELFDGNDIDDREPSNSKKKKKSNARSSVAFDEDGMDEFIDYGDDNPRSFRDEEDDEMGDERGPSQAQLSLATDLFGTGFMDYMTAHKEEDEDYVDEDDLGAGGSRNQFRERGVGVNLYVDSDDDVLDQESSDEDDDDLFESDEDESGKTREQRAEALRLKKEKRRIAKEERRRTAALKKSERRKAKLRRAFEPVQLIENFCTERDDEIRSKDIPERFFDWKTPFYGPQGDNVHAKSVSLEEEEEAEWMVGRIPAIATEYADAAGSGMYGMEQIEAKQRVIVNSIVQALRYMHCDKLEPQFIRRYRMDYVTSPAVRDNLYKIMDEDTEWERILMKKRKVEMILSDLVKISDNDEALGADEENVAKLKEDLRVAQDRLDESVSEEEKIKSEITQLDNPDEDDDDDELFGDDDDDEEKAKKKDENEKKKDAMQKHLKTTQHLVQVCAEQVTQLQTSLKIAEEKSSSSNPGRKNAVDTANKVCKNKLWNAADYKSYMSRLNEYRQITDVHNYLSLIKEGTDAVRTKNNLGGGDGAADEKKRSRRFDRDYYRTCVSQGLRAISYRFVLSPFRAGIKLEDNMTLPNGFDWGKTLPGQNGMDEDVIGDPRQWNTPTIDGTDPSSFASDLVSSGELLLLASMTKTEDGEDLPEANDPLRGCRYVAAMELAYEPRIRKHLREMYRKNAVLTTRPTASGLDSIDAFHEFYGLHLLCNKSLKDHFIPEEREVEMQKMGMNAEERKEIDAKIQRIVRESCHQYMNVLKAEQGGHIKHFIHLPFVNGGADDEWYKKGDNYFTSYENHDYSILMEELQKIYLPSNPDTEDWNEERNKILRLALTNFILPQFENEMKNDLRKAAVKIGIEAAGESLSAMATEGPYRPSHLLGENRFLVKTGDLPIVGVCCSSDNKDASYLAAVSERGELVDHLAVPGGTQIDGNKMREKVITFLMQARPSAIVVGSLGGLSCRLVARKLGALATQATEKWTNRHIQGQEEDDEEFNTRMLNDNDDEGHEWKCNVELVDDNVAQLFGRSVRGKKEFPDYAVNLKCAISIARHAKDPLAELTYAWGVASDAGVFGAEMLYMNIHPLQQLLPKSLLLREYERVLCTATSDVGVDLNLSCKFDHLHGLLTFVPGIGPRKAASLKHSMHRIGGTIASRREILAKRLLGPVVYNNAVAFLRIRDIDFLHNQLLHPLDDTRLHPDVYIRNSWATKIAIDALEMDNGDNASNGDKEDRAIAAIRDIKQDSKNEINRLFNATKNEWERVYGPNFNIGAWDPKLNVPADKWRDKVDELDLDTFAEMLETSGVGKWLTHLTMIKWEFRLPFEDPRKPMEPLDREKLFRLLTKETDHSLCPGKEVTGKVIRTGEFGAHLKLEGDVPAFLPLRNLADGHVESVEDMVQVGSIVTAIVTEVKKDHMSVDLSMKKEDMRKNSSSWERPSSLPPIDPSFDATAAARIESQKNKEREERLAAALSTRDVEMGNSTKTVGRTGRVTRRACDHPAFRNANNSEIDKEMMDGGEVMVGEALVRPSSQKADVLAVHWLVRKNVMKVVEVIEEDKDNDASIGNTLKIKDDVYGSIDELLARYIAPMNDRVEELLSHRKFLHLLEKDVDEKLKDMKRQTPNGIFYYLCWNEKYPGYASLRYVVNTPRNHHIGITPDGFTWQHKSYHNLNLLLNAFKKNPRGQSTVVSSSRQSIGTSSLRTSTTRSDSRSSRWGATKSEQSDQSSMTPIQPPPPSNAGGWAAPPPPPVQANAGGWGNRPPLPASVLPPPPQHGYRPAPPSGPPPSYPPTSSAGSYSSSSYRQ